jgi:hypothetical protein
LGWNSDALPVKILLCKSRSRKLQFHNPLQKRGQQKTAALGKCHYAAVLTMQSTFSEKNRGEKRSIRKKY